MSATDEVILRSSIGYAFRARKKPVWPFVSTELTADEKVSIGEISKKEWKDISVSDWEMHFDVINLLSPEAFCYYLPGLLDASIREKRPHMVAVTTVFSMLDRTPDKELWDDLFSERWTLLNADELTAVEAWVFWLASADNFGFDEISLMRVLENLELLKQSKGL